MAIQEFVAGPISELVKYPSQFVISSGTYLTTKFNEICYAIQDKTGSLNNFFLHPWLVSYALIGGLIIEKVLNKKQENLEEKLKFSQGQSLLRYH